MASFVHVSPRRREGFKEESLELIEELLEILESVEEDITQNERLEEYGQIVDRIMGAAKSFAASEPMRFLWILETFLASL